MSFPLLAPIAASRTLPVASDSNSTIRDREAAAAFLIAVLGESPLVGWCIGHARRRPVHNDAVTTVEQPVSGLMRLVAVSGLPNQPRKEQSG